MSDARVRRWFLSLCGAVGLQLGASGARAEGAVPAIPYALVIGSNASGGGNESSAMRSTTPRPSPASCARSAATRTRTSSPCDRAAAASSACWHRCGGGCRIIDAWESRPRSSSTTRATPRADALTLGDEELPLVELRREILALPSTLTIVVIDACQSGAFSRVKGAEATADFSFNSVARLNTAGLAVIASSAARDRFIPYAQLSAGSALGLTHWQDASGSTRQSFFGYHLGVDVGRR